MKKIKKEHVLYNPDACEGDMGAIRDDDNNNMQLL